MVGSTAALLSLALGTLESPASQFRAGGIIGSALSSFLAGFLNRTGAAILLLTLLAFSVIMATQFSFSQAFSALATYFRARRGPLQWYRDWSEERRRNRERQVVVDKHMKKAGRERAPEIASKSRGTRGEE